MEAVLNRLFTVGHRPRYEGYEETTEDEGGSSSIVIDKADVVDIAGRINTKKAVRVDGVPGDIMRLIASCRSELVTSVLNDITDSGRIAKCWKTARVILLRKPGKDPRLPNAYRPISILPALSKIWEKCLKRNIKRCIGVDSFHRRQYFQRR